MGAAGRAAAEAERARRHMPTATLAALVVVAAGLLASALTARSLARGVDGQTRDRFERLADHVETEVGRRLHTFIYGLRGASGLFLVKDEVSRDDFRAYVASRDLAREFTGAAGLGFVARVRGDALGSFVEAARAGGAPGFTVRPPGARADHYVVTFAEPAAGRAVVGYDMGTEPERRATADRAMLTGEPMLTGAIALVPGVPSPRGLLYLLPVYRRGAPLRTPAERAAACRGWISFPIIIAEVFRALPQIADGLIGLEIFDGEGPAAEALLYATERTAGPEEDEGPHRLSRLPVGGRLWTLRLRGRPALAREADWSLVTTVLVLGPLLSLLLGVLIWSWATREAAEESSRAKSELLANVSHELRTPLTAILGYADILQNDREVGESPEQRGEILATIRGAGQHLLTVINDLLDLSKIEAGKVVLEALDTDLPALLREVEALVRPRAGDKGLALRVELRGPVPQRIVTDPTRLRQVLLNLLGNAVKFTERGGVTLAVAVDRAAARLILDVEDRGPGLTEAQAAALFRPFSQGDASTTRTHGGTGLGLTISRRLGRLMGGDVTLLRSAPGQGTCFRVAVHLRAVAGAAWIDALPDGERVKAAGPSPPEVTLPGRILLAEDGRDNQRLIAFILRKAGAEVHVADNGRAALEMLEAAQAEGRDYDLLLTDVQMPEMDGHTLAREVRTRGARLPVIALTAQAMAEDRQRCLDAGCDDYATKPIDRAALLSVCSRWIQGRGQAA